MFVDGRYYLVPETEFEAGAESRPKHRGRTGTEGTSAGTLPRSTDSDNADEETGTGGDTVRFEIRRIGL